MGTKALLTFLLALCAPTLLWAQNGKISGSVVDRLTGEPLPGATVVIDGTSRGSATDADGSYVILDVAPGTYTLRTSFVGYGTQVVQNVAVSSGFTTIVDFELAAGVELEEVVVQGERLIRQDEVSTTTILRGEQIKSLPVEGFASAMTLTSGVVESSGGDDNGIHVRGGRSGEIAYIVDGVLVEDPFSGGLGGFDVARQSIDELQVMTGGFSAEYGKAMSGIVLINTPAGTPNFHGSLRLQTDGYSMEGLGQGGPSAGYTRPMSNDWGTRIFEAALSGPVWKDRVTFFVNADRLDTDTYLNEFDGPARPAVLPWSQLVGYEFMRTVQHSFQDANAQPVEVDLAALGLEEGTVITEDHIEQLRQAGVDVDRLAEAAVGDYRQHHQLGLYSDRTRVTANMGLKLTRDMDARLSYKMTRRDWRDYRHWFKFMPQYNGQQKRNIDVFGGEFTHRLSSRAFYELSSSYTSNRYWYYLYDEQLNESDPWRFGRVFSPFSVSGAFETDGLSDAEGGNNYDFAGYSPADVYIDYPYLLDGDLGEAFRLARSLDLNGDGSLDFYREDRLTEELVSQLRELFASKTDEELQAMGLSRGVIPILAPPTDNFYQERRIGDFQINANFSAQVNDANFIKTGIQFRQLRLRNYGVFANNVWDPTTNPADPNTLTKEPTDEDYVDASPFELAAFVTDKVEFGNLVVQAGLRLDVLDPDMVTFANYGAGGVIQRPGSENDPAPTPVDPELKWKISPRLGLAFPLTDRARVSFNYGQFIQYPEYNRLYQNYRTATWVPGSGYVPLESIGFDLGFETFLGNPNVDPERTIFYQIDSEFLVNDNFKLGAALFYKDIYDYVAVRRVLGQGGRAFWIMDNLDYANARGFEVRAEQRMSEVLGFTASYTYSRAIGNADDYSGAYDDWYLNSVYGTIPPKGSQPLDWDQPHTFNFTTSTRYGGFFLNVLGRFGSGLPYTPTSSRGRPLGPKNSARRPWTGVVDLRLEYELDLAGATMLRPFLQVTNLLDRVNVLSVYDDTGSPQVTLDPGTQFEAAQRPSYLGPPRHVEVGVELTF